MTYFLKPVFVFLVLTSSIAFAANDAAAEERCESKGYCISLAAVAEAQGLEFLGIKENASPGEALAKIYSFAMGLIGLASLVMLTFAGVWYATAGDSQERTKQAVQYMQNAVFGLVLALLSYLILFTINPDLVSPLKLNLTKIQPIGEGITPIYNLKNGYTAKDCVAAGGTPTDAEGKFVCLSKDALARQKISWDAQRCKDAGGEIITTSLGTYCSKQFK